MVQPLNWYSLAGEFADIGTAETVRFVVPKTGYLRKVELSLGGAITGADETVTVSHNNTALSPTITVANASSAEGDYDFAEFGRAVTKGDWIEVATAGNSTGPQKSAITITLSQ